MHPAAIAFQDPARLHARCEISGVRRFTLRPGYETTVVVPDEVWEPLPDGYPERFAPSIFTRDSGLVELFRLPDTVFDVPTATALVEMLGDAFPITLGETTDPAGLPSTHTPPTPASVSACTSTTTSPSRTPPARRPADASA
ncbi:hypothetical protein [Kitasatospora sp. MBT66]|uniref:hypothetical protein n=1 Tax=Kitasatospora sp. MBT66 TaxID=1444769 RepID=UPI0005BAE02F|nr:hypothetical protein [Kitasatospora sp. MBT66]